MSSSDPREDLLLPPDVSFLGANNTLSVLQHAKLLSINALCDIIRDPEQSAQDRRLAAVAILRYAAASEPRPPAPEGDEVDHLDDDDEASDQREQENKNSNDLHSFQREAPGVGSFRAQTPKIPDSLSSNTSFPDTYPLGTNAWLPRFSSEKLPTHLSPLHPRQATVLACAGSPTSLSTASDTLSQLLPAFPPRAGPQIR